MHHRLIHYYPEGSGQRDYLSKLESPLEKPVLYFYICVQCCVFAWLSSAMLMCIPCVSGLQTWLRVLAVTRTSAREWGLYSMQITLAMPQQLLLCIGPSVSCWLPKCLRQPCFCPRLCLLPCPAHFSEVRWLLMAVSRQRAHSVATLRGHARGWGQPGAGLGGRRKGGGTERVAFWGVKREGLKPRRGPPLCNPVTFVWQPLLCACLNCPSQLALISYSVRMSKHSGPNHPAFT